jgi:hypothetical protein
MHTYTIREWTIEINDKLKVLMQETCLLFAVFFQRNHSLLEDVQIQLRMELFKINNKV